MIMLGGLTILVAVILATCDIEVRYTPYGYKTVVMTVPLWFSAGMALLPSFMILRHQSIIVRRESRSYIGERVFKHESMHQVQMRRHGWFRWAWRWLTDGMWRAKFELEGYATQVIYDAQIPIYAEYVRTHRIYTWPSTGLFRLFGVRFFRFSSPMPECEDWYVKRLTRYVEAERKAVA